MLPVHGQLYAVTKWCQLEAYIKELMKYSDPLVMVTEPVAAVTEFLETSTIYPGADGGGVYVRHKYRPWSKHSYRIVFVAASAAWSTCK